MEKDAPSLNIKNVLRNFDDSYWFPFVSLIILLTIGEFWLDLIWYYNLIFSIIAVIVGSYHLHGTDYLRDTIVSKLKKTNKGNQTNHHSNLEEKSFN